MLTSALSCLQSWELERCTDLQVAPMLLGIALHLPVAALLSSQAMNLNYIMWRLEAYSGKGKGRARSVKRLRKKQIWMHLGSAMLVRVVSELAWCSHLLAVERWMDLKLVMDWAPLCKVDHLVVEIEVAVRRFLLSQIV